MPFRLVTALIAAAFCLFLATWSFVQDPKRLTNRSFAFFNLCLAIWDIDELLVYTTPAHHLFARNVYRLSYVGSSLIPLAFLTFMFATMKRPPTVIVKAYRVACVLLSIASLTPLVIR